MLMRMTMTLDMMRMVIMDGLDDVKNCQMRNLTFLQDFPQHILAALSRPPQL